MGMADISAVVTHSVESDMFRTWVAAGAVGHTSLGDINIRVCLNSVELGEVVSIAVGLVDSSFCERRKLWYFEGIVSLDEIFGNAVVSREVESDVWQALDKKINDS